MKLFITKMLQICLLCYVLYLMAVESDSDPDGIKWLPRNEVFLNVHRFFVRS